MNDDLIITKKDKKKRGDDGYKVFSIRIKDDLVAKIDALSAQSGRSRNELIGLLLDYAVKHSSIPK